MSDINMPHSHQELYASAGSVARHPVAVWKVLVAVILLTIVVGGGWTGYQTVQQWRTEALEARAFLLTPLVDSKQRPIMGADNRQIRRVDVLNVVIERAVQQLMQEAQRQQQAPATGTVRKP